MTNLRWLVVAILFGLVQMAMISTASAEEDFYWKNSYGRGAGTIPPCRGDKEKQSGLGHHPCKAGYHGKGPVCWHEQAGKAAAGSKNLEETGKLMTKLKPIIDKVKTAANDLKTDLVDSNRGAALVDKIHKAWKELPYTDQLGLKVAIRSFKTTGSITAGVIDNQLSPIDLVRDASQVVSILDETGLMSVVASLMYPVYGIDYGSL